MSVAVSWIAATGFAVLAWGSRRLIRESHGPAPPPPLPAGFPEAACRGAARCLRLIILIGDAPPEAADALRDAGRREAEAILAQVRDWVAAVPMARWPEIAPPGRERMPWGCQPAAWREHVNEEATDLLVERLTLWAIWSLASVEVAPLRLFGDPNVKA